VKQGRVGGALVERKEDDVSDAGETFEGPSDLPARVQADRSRPHLIDHDRDRRR